VVARDPSAITYIKWVQLDTPMMLIIVTLVATLLVGLASTFLGLACHHERHRGLAEASESHLHRGLRCRAIFRTRRGGGRWAALHL
jgi:hypothetical protein